MRNLLACLLVGVALSAAWYSYSEWKGSPKAPCPDCSPKPAPLPIPVPPPKKPSPSPWGPGDVESVDSLRMPLKPSPGTGPQVGGPVGPGGEEVMCDLPVSLRKNNVGGIDGAGLCVFTSIMHAARYQNVKELWDFQEKMTHEPGGGYPAKVDRMMAKYAPGVHYLQAETNDPAVLDLAFKTGRMPSATYCGWDPTYGGRYVSHMTNPVYLDDKVAAVLDNNRVSPDEASLMWMSRSDYLARWKGQDRTAWVVILLGPAPAPVPLPNK